MRKLKKVEYDLIVFLLNDVPNTQSIVKGLLDKMVEEMDDGGMGSLKFLSNDAGEKMFGEEIAIATLLDIDGTPVNFAVNLDKEGDIYELDVFKADFSPLKQFPIPPYKLLPPPLRL